jgi:fumarate hydratase subunit alpha
MRTFDVNYIKEKVKEICMELAYKINDDVKEALEAGQKSEVSQLGRDVLCMLLENANIAESQDIPICQDTGMVIVNFEIGQDAELKGGFIGDAVNQGVREAYEEGYLRKSVVDPITRINTKDNTPAIINYELVPGEKITMSILLKGFGSENMGKVKMLTPSEGIPGIIEFVLDTIKSAGGNPCPPLVIGIGIGGTMDKATAMAKKALFRAIGKRSDDAFLSELEEKLLKGINELNIGPMGFGGNVTGLEVFAEKYPTHLAGLPVAVNINCHALRRKIVEL